MIDDLSMAHDNLQRELSDIKRLIGKDKHELIKSNIALNRKVKELEKDCDYISHQYALEVEQNKRYREALEFYANEENYFFDEKEYKVGLGVPESEITIDYGNKARKALEGEE